MQRIGLTGGIGTGKSAVAAMLREMGFIVLDADALAHILIEPGQLAYGEVLAEFGTSIANKNGQIDRTRLAAAVFADRAKLARLNSIIHPRIEQVILRKFEQLEKSGTPDAAFVEAALLVETGIYKKLDALIVTWCTPEQQRQRLMARGMSEADARLRIESQQSTEEKLRHATYSIDCSRSLEDTRKQVEALLPKFRSAVTPST
jgi:dephospho-CoA kinase